MGHPVNDYVKGDDCVVCWPAGQTPKYIKVSFSGTRKDGTYVLTQTIPCHWYYGGPPPAFHIELSITPLHSWVQSEENWAWVFDGLAAACSAEINDPVRNAWANVWHDTHPAVAAMIGSGYLWSGLGSRYEVNYKGNSKWTFGMRNIRVPANILVQYEP